MSKIPKWLKITGAVLIGLIIIGAIASSGEQTKTEDNKQEQTSQATETEKPAEQARRCLEVSEKVVKNYLEEGLNTEGITLLNAKAVKSNDFENVYFISADMQGAGLENEDDIVTLTTNSLEGDGIFMSVNPAAIEFFVFPDASATDAKATMSNDGAKESQTCVNG